MRAIHIVQEKNCSTDTRRFQVKYPAHRTARRIGLAHRNRLLGTPSASRCCSVWIDKSRPFFLLLRGDIPKQTGLSQDLVIAPTFVGLIKRVDSEGSKERIATAIVNPDNKSRTIEIPLQIATPAVGVRCPSYGYGLSVRLGERMGRREISQIYLYDVNSDNRRFVRITCERLGTARDFR